MREGRKCERERERNESEREMSERGVKVGVVN